MAPITLFRSYHMLCISFSPISDSTEFHTSKILCFNTSFEVISYSFNPMSISAHKYSMRSMSRLYGVYVTHAVYYTLYNNHSSNNTNLVALSSKLFFKIFKKLCSSKMPSIKTKLPVPFATTHLHNITEPPQYFTAGRKFLYSFLVRSRHNDLQPNQIY